MYVDLIFAQEDADRTRMIENRLAKAERIVHETFADDPTDRDCRVYALFAESPDHDPRHEPTPRAG